jgi:hypothetical protein
MEPTMDDATKQDLAALADGTLAPAGREELLRRAESSPELAGALADQRRALAAISAADAPASAALHASVAAMVAAAEAASDAPRRRLRAPRLPRRRLALPLGAGAVAVAAAAVLLLTGGAPAGPSVAEAAQAALAPASAPAPAARPGAGTLSASVDGVAYPYWADSTGWRAVGARSDVKDGRTVRTVAYENAGGRRIGYAIAEGGALRVDGGSVVVRDGVRMRVLHSGGAAIVTWLRGGHTCILAARGVSPDVLVRLAAWQA